jgi:hypothetical protein
MYILTFYKNTLKLLQITGIYIFLTFMKMIGKNSIITKTIIIGIIGIMGMIVINKGIFMHTHKIDENTYIIHSHPYNKSKDSEPYKTHHHTKAQFFFIQNIQNLFPLFFLTFTFSPFIKKTYSYFDTKSVSISEFIFIKKGRAPPAS